MRASPESKRNCASRDCSSSCRDSSSAKLRQKVQSLSSISRASVSLFAAASSVKSAALSLAALSLKPPAAGGGAGSAARKVALASTSSSAAAKKRMVMVRSCRPPRGGATIGDGHHVQETWTLYWTTVQLDFAGRLSNRFDAKPGVSA